MIWPKKTPVEDQPKKALVLRKNTPAMVAHKVTPTAIFKNGTTTMIADNGLPITDVKNGKYRRTVFERIYEVRCPMCKTCFKTEQYVCRQHSKTFKPKSDPLVTVTLGGKSRSSIMQKSDD